MNFLFVHQNFPGQYIHLLRNLLADNAARPGTHEIVFMTEPNQNYIEGVRKVTYSRPPPPPQALVATAREFEMASVRAQACYNGALQIKALGFKPDIIIGHHGWGEMLNLCDVFPGVPILGYFEFYYRIHNSDVNFDPEFPMEESRFGVVRGKNTINHLAIGLEQWGQTPTRWQYDTYPEWARQKIKIIEEGVDLDICSPDAALYKKTVKVGPLSVSPRQKLLTFVSRNLEPYRGFHTLMRALPEILKERRDLLVSIVGGDEVSYGAPPPNGGSWKDVLLKEVGNKIDLSRVHFMGKVKYDDHLTLLKRSNAHVYLSYPFVASWSLRESLACGCPIIGADSVTVAEFIQNEQNGILTPTLDSNKLAKNVLRVLGDTKLASKLRKGARAYAEANLGMDNYIQRYRAYIEEIVGKKMLPKTRPTPASARATRKPERAAKAG
ncbi:glycosyltransferase [Acidocella aminolytica]|uniref:Glycosyl transferase n=1 Tax=Acidocella aminolytica 101 = DSM 11237 TaxID=1120923 RepID=A0A0D6PDL8_9PROT|nr:glycosyltransferase [Acidocella aminolytica]GAN79293.1 glycosyl transferase [Acidocella aminolytica 101 = DSM 11237]GBQ39619.1 glycosyltransferase [Acidocella aminolytica 101 = DSM 11237]SHE37702.1 Glycosyltransferase involved in cell wall bisynthesis [Acidocella aminolytica 101 = DSM 11237]